MEAAAGLYRNATTGVPLTIERDGDVLRVERGQPDGLNPQRGQPLVATSASSFVTATGQKWQLAGRTLRMTDPFGTVDTYERVTSAKPSIAQLNELAGTYASDEAETTLTVAVNGDALVIRRRPDTTLKLTPVYADAFTAPQLGLVIFRRDAGRVTALGVVEDRVWDMRFARQSTRGTTSSNQH